MTIKTTCERVQPWVVGIDEKGEFIWEGRAMDRWQMELLPRKTRSDDPFLRRWNEVADFQENAREFDPSRGDHAHQIAYNKQKLDSLRRMFPKRGSKTR